MVSKCPKCNLDLNGRGNCLSCGYIGASGSKSFSLKWLIAGLLMLTILAGSAYVFLSDFSIRFIVTKFLHGAENGLSIDPPSFEVVGTLKQTYTLDELMEFRKLLENRQFEDLTRAAIEIQAAFEDDPMNEYQVYDFFNFFKSADPEHEKMLSSWVENTPSSFAPHLARAHYYYFNGWAARGTKIAKNTDAMQFDNMSIFFMKCREDIDAALAINPRLLTAHSMLIGMANALGSVEDENSIIESASVLFPGSFLIYKDILWAKIPRWGGSLREMEKLAVKAFKHIDSNEELYMLFGKIYIQAAWNHRQIKEYDKALALCDKALQYGDDSSIYEEQSHIYCEMKQYDQALEAVNQAISLRPTTPSPFLHRALIHTKMDMLQEAVADFRYLEMIVPGDPQTVSSKNSAAIHFFNMGQRISPTSNNIAIDYYDKALVLKPCYDEALHWKGVAYSRMSEFDKGYNTFREAIQCGSRKIETFKLIDYILMPQNKWDEIIGYWNVYLAWDPNNGEAYLERAGSYKHKGDMESSLADYKRSCDLGQQKACNIIKRYQ